VEAATCKKELVIEIPVEDVRRQEESVTSQYRKTARIPGFRQGKVPISVIRRHFRDDIKNEVVQKLVPKFFDHAVRAQKLSVVGEPHFEDLKFEPDQPLTLKATFEVTPDFELKEYKGLEVEEVVRPVTDEDIHHTLEHLQDRAATFEVVQDRPSQEGDYVTVNYFGKDVNNTAAEPLQAKDAVVHLTAEGTVAEFTRNLLGVQAGQVREFDVTYPEDYAQKSLVGRTFHYRVEVQSVKKKVVPPLDDELAKAVSEQSTLEELREHLRKEMTAGREKQAAAEAKQKLAEELLKGYEFPVPETLLEGQINRRMQRMLMELIRQGIDPKTIQVDWHKVREDSRPEAEKQVRIGLILEKVAEAEKLEATDEDVDDLIREMAAEQRETPAALKTRLTRDGELDRLKLARRNQKALDALYQNAKIIRKTAASPAPAESDPEQTA
jgi:trigger factor